MNALNLDGSSRWYAPAAICLAVAAVLALPLDLPLARLAADLAAEHRLPGELHKLVEFSEVFAHGMGIGLILLAVFVLDRGNRSRLPRLATASLGAGLLADLVKPLIARTRPHASDLQAGVAETFHGFLLVLRPDDGVSAWDHAMQSFPSGHTAAAVGLAVGLTWLYPHGRWFFVALAVLGGCQRIESGSHFLSDTLAAASLACLWAGACTDSRRLGRLFDRWERRITSGRRGKNCETDPAVMDLSG